MNVPSSQAAVRPVDVPHDRTLALLDKGIATIVLFVVASALTAVRTSPIPYLWIAIAAIIVLSYAAVLCTSQGLRALWVNLAVVIFALGAAESYFWAQEPLERRMEYSDEFFEADEVLGYKPAANRRISHRSYGGDQLLYDVTYTFNEQGLRTASSMTGTHAATQPCLVFFGDSFTFGEGMTDEQTMPYQVWKRIGHRFLTVNFGFLGYGPHQMLAALEHGQIESRGHCSSSHIIYQAIPTHASRAAGLEVWDHHGPRYMLNAEGQAQPSGHFDDTPPATILERLRVVHRQFSPWLKTTLEQSALYRTLLRTHRPVDEQDTELFGAIVGKSKQVIERMYPGAQLHVILWDYDDDREVVKQIQQALAHQAVQVSIVSTILPDFPANRAQYEISPYDRHPNALAHAIIAKFVAHALVR